MNIFKRSPNKGTTTPTSRPSSSSSLRAFGVREGLDARPDSKADAAKYNVLASADVTLSDAFSYHDVLSVVRDTRDIDNKRRRKYLYTIPIPQGDGFFPFAIPPQEMSQAVIARIPSPTGQKICILRQQRDDDDKNKQQVLEIWTNECQTLENRIILPSKTMHGKVVNDVNWFGRMQWNQEETCLVYSAERQAPKTTSFFDVDDDDVEKDEKVRGGENTMGLGKTEHWGEKYTDVSALLDLFVVNIETGNVGRVENVPGGVDVPTSHGGFTLGQASFSPCGTHIVYTAWDAGGGSQMPRRLGMTYCLQRPSKIYASPINNLMERLAHDKKETEKKASFESVKDDECVCLTQGARISRSPRFSPVKNDVSKMVYLCSKLGFDTHNGGVALHVIDWNVTEGAPDLDSQNIWISTIHAPPPLSGDQDTDVQVGNMAFPGLYTQSLPQSCCTDEFLLITTQWGSVQRILRVSLANGNMTLLNCDIARGKGLSTEISASQSLLCVTADGGAVISESAPNRPAIVAFVSREALARDKVYIKVDAPLVAEMGPIAATAFSQVSRDVVAESLDFSYEMLAMRPPQIADDDETKVQWILLRPKVEEGCKPPLIVVPHGGPHSCTPTTYLPSYAYLCASGYAVLHVNYRGSIGFGQGALDALPGNVGLLDVKDVMHATVTMIDSGWVDGERVGICGGSHGGFLAGHCIGQFPELFNACVMRNPVTNIASMLTATDIPDWCYVEALGSGYYNWKEYRSASREELDVMWEASPIKHAMSVVTPTLMALGLQDQRVPPSQGREYYHVLRANGVTTKLLMYDKDDHAIDKVESEGDLWINIKQWFDRYL